MFYRMYRTLIGLNRTVREVKEIMQLGAMMLICMIALSCASSKRSDSVPPHFPERQFTAPWSMDALTLERFKANVNTIDVGDDLTRVVKLLGPPDADKRTTKNENIRIFEYYVRRQFADSPNEADKYVSIVLNDHDAVKSIYSNVENIPSKNLPY